MPQISSNPFLAALARSGLLDSEQFNTIAAVIDPATEPRFVATQLVRDQVLTPWQAKFLLSGRDTLIIGKYALLERWSQDQLGDKFLAVHQQLGRRVDLQILPANLSQQAESLQRFLRETTAAAKLDSAAIVHVYDVDQHQGRYYIVSEHFDARTLDQILASREPWSLEAMAMVAEQWLAGVSYALHQGVLHRDLGPASLRVSADGVAKVGNFALGALAGRLNQGEADVAVAATAEDDISQLGKALVQFVDGCASTADPHHRQRLRTIFDQLTRVRSWETELPRIQANLQQWIVRHGPGATPALTAEIRKSDSPPAAPHSAQRWVGVNWKNLPRKTWVIAASAGGGLILIGLIWWIFGAGPPPQNPEKMVDRVSGESRGTRRSGSSRTDERQKASREGQAAEPSLDEALLRRQRAADEAPDATPPDAPAPETPSVAQGAESAAGNASSAPSKAVNPATPTPDAPTTAPQVPPSETADGTNPAPAPPEKMEPPTGESLLTVAEVVAQENRQGGNPPVSPSENPPPAPSAPADGLAAPFAHFPAAIDLPLESSTEPVAIGAIHVGQQDLVGLRLDWEPELTRKTEFALVRAPGEGSQRWTVTADAKGSRDAVAIGEFAMEGEQLQFRWRSEAAANSNFGYLRNCLLKVECRNDFRYLPLRASVELAPLVITAEVPQAKVEFDLPYLPERELLQVTVVQIGTPTTPPAEDFLFVFEPTEQIIPERGACAVFLTQKTDRFFRLDLEAKLAKKSSLTGKFLLITHDGSGPERLYSTKALEDLSAWYTNHAAALNSQVQELKLYREQNEEQLRKDHMITKHEEAVKAATDALEVGNLLVSQLEEQRAATAHLFGKPIQIRVSFKVKDQAVELVRMVAAAAGSEPRPAP